MQRIQSALFCNRLYTKNPLYVLSLLRYQILIVTGDGSVSKLLAVIVNMEVFISSTVYLPLCTCFVSALTALLYEFLRRACGRNLYETSSESLRA